MQMVWFFFVQDVLLLRAYLAHVVMKHVKVTQVGTCYHLLCWIGGLSLMNVLNAACWFSLYFLA